MSGEGAGFGGEPKGNKEIVNFPLQGSEPFRIALYR
ncbi:unnamed protein product, partial [marine sediment metagenome]